MVGTLKVVYWNVHKRYEVLQELYGTKEKYDIVAITEPPHSGNVPGTRCPRNSGYTIVQWTGEGRTRAAILIGPETKVVDAEARPDWCRVTVDVGEGKQMDVYAVYSPSPAHTSSTEWSTPINELLERQPARQSLVVGDFNLHSAEWMPGRRTYHVGATKLRTLAEQWGLVLLTPAGTGTYINPRGEDTTLDLAWVTEGSRAEYKGTPKHRGSDHLPQEVWIPKEGDARERKKPGLSWKLMDKEGVKGEAKKLPQPGDLTTSAELDGYVAELTAAIWGIAEKYTPERKGGPPRNEWWTPEVRTAVKEAATLADRYRRVRTETSKRHMREAEARKKRLIKEAQRAAFRKALYESTREKDGKTMWAISKWARLRSHKPPSPALIPALRTPGQGGTRATSFEEKVEALSRKFYPASPADLSDIVEQEFEESSFTAATEMPLEISETDIRRALGKVRPWKAPGSDGIPNGLLKALGEPLRERLAAIATASMTMGYYPRTFREARTVVLPKDKKEMDTVGAWRPIALLKTMGKVIESVMARRIADEAEKRRILPDEQMGNRRNRSCEAALQFIIDLVETVWDEKMWVSLLALDVTGAFDRVCHIRLLDDLRKMGFPFWVVRWIKSFLHERATTLQFDGDESAPIRIHAGVPQGSPLSPILFILYSTALYNSLRTHLGINTVGFADDSTLLSFGKNRDVVCKQLRDAHVTCTRWATRYGMSFNLAKYQLVHFTKTRRPEERGLQLGDFIVKATPAAKVLGAMLDWRLSGNAHQQYLRKKMTTQKLSIEKTLASTWGPSLRRSRTVYTAVIRAAIGYASPGWHSVTEGKRPQTLLYKDLHKLQRSCLRAVTGAYNATRTAILETEAFVPPIDIWLNSKLYTFVNTYEGSGLAGISRDRCNNARDRLRRSRRRRTEIGPPTARPPATFEKKANKALEWNARGPAWNDEKVLETWTERWKLEQTKRSRGRHGAVVTTADKPPSGDTLSLHDGLAKSESSLLIQMRTECIGLNAFLFERRVPGADPGCECGQAQETVKHIIGFCPLRQTERLRLRERLGHDSVERALSGKHAGTVAKWFMDLGRIKHYDLARRLVETWTAGRARDEEE